MKSEEDDLKDFFLEMKKGDASREVPPLAKLLRQQKQQKLPVWAVVAATINIILFVGGFWYQSLQPAKVVDALPHVDTPPSIDQNSDMMTWETPTDKLLTNF
jgi:type VI protein secretion system component VasF